MSCCVYSTVFFTTCASPESVSLSRSEGWNSLCEGDSPGHITRCWQTFSEKADMGKKGVGVWGRERAHTCPVSRVISWNSVPPAQMDRAGHYGTAWCIRQRGPVSSQYHLHLWSQEKAMSDPKLRTAPGDRLLPISNQTPF